MTESEKLRKEMEKKGLLGTTVKKTIVRTTAAKDKGAGVKSSAPSLLSQGQKAEVVQNTGLLTKPVLTKTVTKKQSGSRKDVFQRSEDLLQDTSLSYNDKKKEIDALDKELGKMRDKNLIASMLGNENAKNTISRVTEMQNRLAQEKKSTAFGAGFGQAAGLKSYDAAVKSAAKKTGDTDLLSRMESQDEMREKTKEKFGKAYSGGELAGELTKGLILYGTAGAAAEKAALAGIAKVTGGRTLGEAGTFAARMLGQQAADTAVMTPLTIVEGMADGKEKDEILKDVARQQTTDAVFNVGLGTLGMGIGAARKAAEPFLENRRAAKAAKQAAETSEEAVKAAEKTEAVKALRQEQMDPVMRETAEEAPDILLKESREALTQEYKDLNNGEYIDARLRKVLAEEGEDAMNRELKEMDARREDLEEMLGIRTKKVQDAERRIRNEGVKSMKKLFSISGQAETKELKEMMVKAYREGVGGKISRETREEIFDALFGRGIIRTTDHIDEELKNYLKNTTLRVAREDAANITDLNTKKYFNKLKKVEVVQDGGKGNIDNDIYPALSKRWPEHFPADITNPGDQLKQILDVAEGQKVKNLELADAMDEGAKAGMREEFEAAMDEVEKQAAKMTDYLNERRRVQMRKASRSGAGLDFDQMDEAGIKAIYDDLYQAKKARDRVERKTLLTDPNKTIVDKLIAGEMTEAQARKIAGDYGDDVMAMYAVEKPYRALDKSIKAYKRHANSRALNDVQKIVGPVRMRDEGLEGFKDMPMLSQIRETMERIIDKVAPNKATAESIKDGIFRPIHNSERDRVQFINRLKQPLREMGISTKENIRIALPGTGKKKCSESALVQWLGEKRYDLKTMMDKAGKTVDELNEMEELRRTIETVEMGINSEQMQRINGCIDRLTETYKEIHPMINRALIRNGYDPIGYIEGYFPHMNFDDPTDLMGTAMKKMGFDFASKELPMDIAGRTETFRPGKKWSGNLLKREGTQTDYDALRAFDQYIENVSDVIYHTDNIKRLRAYEDYLRYELSDSGVKKQIDEIRDNPMLTEFDKQVKIDEVYSGLENHRLQNYVMNLRSYSDQLAGKKHKIDRILETELFGRKVYKAVNELENRVASNMVGANIGSAMTNFIPITQGMSSMGLKSNLRGLGEALAYMSKGEMDDLTKRSAFLTTRKGTENLYMTGFQKASDLAFKPMEMADTFSTQAVWRSRFHDNVAKGMTEDAAIKEADDFARGLFAGRSKGAMPTAFGSKTLKPLTMFQLEVNNQLSYLMKDIPKNAQGDVKKIMKAYGGIIMGAYIYNDVYEKLTGRRSALDPFGIANDAIGDLTGERVRNTVDILADAAQGEGLQLTEETEQKKASQVMTGLAEELGGNVPFVGGILFDGGRIPIQSALPGMGTITGALADLATGETTSESALQKIGGELKKPVMYLLPPAGGGQIKKTAEGLSMMARGGDYSETADGSTLKFAVDQDNPANWAKSALFGKWATEEGQAYIDNTSSKLGVNQTATYERLREAGMGGKTAFDTINSIRGTEGSAEKRAALRKSGLSSDQQAIIYEDMLASEKDKALMGAMKMRNDLDGAGTDMGLVAAVLGNMAEHAADAPKMNILLNSRLSEADKEYIYMYKMVDEDRKETEKTQLQTVKSAGGDISLFLKLDSTISKLDGKENGKTVNLLKSRRVKAAIDEATPGMSTADRRKLYELWSVSKKVW